MRVGKETVLLENRRTSSRHLKDGKSPRMLHAIGNGRFRGEKVLGRGASGVVCNAWDRELKRNVAIKISHKPTDLFVSESRLVGRLVHRNIAALYEVGALTDLSYVVMEFIDGPALRSFCKKDNLLTPERAVEIMIEVCKGLFFAHEKGIVHRDIKPSNIILTRQGVPKITDFGIAQMEDKTLPEGFWGTPGYTAPEQLNSEFVTVKSDIFSIGCVLYELLEGEKAFRGENCYSVLFKIINESSPPLTHMEPMHQEVLETIVRKSLAKDPCARYRNCLDFGIELSRALGYLNSRTRKEKSARLTSFFHPSKLIRTRQPGTRP
jgi:eukaryotic-like serine/threonine-protein kinase